MKRQFVATLIVTILALSPSLVSAADWGKYSREELFSPGFPEAPGADAVVLLDEGTLRVDEQGRSKLFRHRRTKIFTEVGASRSVFRIPLRPDDRIEDFRAQTLVPPDRVVKVESDAVRDEVGPDGRELVVEFPAVAPGVLLEMQYEHRSNDLSSVDPWAFQGEDFTRTSRFDLLIPDGISYYSFLTGFAGEEPAGVKERVSDPYKPRRKLNRVRWELRNQAPISEVPYLASAEGAKATVYVQFEKYLNDHESHQCLRSWEELASEAAREDASRLGKIDMKGPASPAAGASASTREEQARALYVQARDEIIGEGADRNVWLVSALRDAGFDAFAVRIRTRDRGTFQTQWHALEALNHSIVLVDLGAGPVHLDASEPELPFGFVAPRSRVDQGLRVSETAGGLVALESSVPASRRVAKTQCTVAADGGLSARSVVKLTGDHAWEARRSIHAHGDEAWAARLLAGRKGVRVDGVEVRGLGSPEDPLAVKITWAADHWAMCQDPAATGRGAFLFADCKNPFLAPARDYPIDFGWAGSTKEELNIKFPQGSTIAKTPKNSSARAAGLAHSLTWSRKNTTLKAVRKVNIGERAISESQYATVREFWADMVAADGAEISAKVPGAREVRTL